jgi:hypothetical protein
MPARKERLPKHHRDMVVSPLFLLFWDDKPPLLFFIRNIGFHLL